MKIILTEDQYISLLKEEKENEIEQTFTNSKKFTKRLLRDVKNQYGIDFNFALTWGSVIWFCWSNIKILRRKIYKSFKN